LGRSDVFKSYLNGDQTKNILQLPMDYVNYINVVKGLEINEKEKENVWSY
jgi:hypothetical protein